MDNEVIYIMKKNLEIIQDYLNGERPITIVGYTGEEKYIVRKVGEKWKDKSGAEWEQTEGGPVRVTKVLDLINQEFECKKCKKNTRMWGSRQDRRFQLKTGMCMDCVIEEETTMRAKGQYKNYERQKVLRNELAHYSDVKKYLEDSKKYLEEHKTFTFVNSNGMVEEWSNEAADDVRKNLKKDYSRCLKEIKRVEKELKVVEDEIAKSNSTR